MLESVDRDALVVLLAVQGPQPDFAMTTCRDVRSRLHATSRDDFDYARRQETMGQKAAISAKDSRKLTLKRDGAT